MKTTGLAFPKGRTRKQAKAKKDRSESAVKRAVRKACVDRDGHCRIREWEDHPDDWHADDLAPCHSFSTTGEHAHMHSHRRSQTRGQAAEKRHTTRASLMLCADHHQQYDAHQLRITALTRSGADGPLKFRRTT
jgi:hypothetical protein